MNKGELIDAVAAELGESKAVASRMIDVVLRAIIHGVEADGKVAIAGFGTFRKKTRKARIAINPATKLPVNIPAATTLGFTASQVLKQTMH